MTYNVSSDFSDSVFVWDDGSLEILNVTKADDGLYTCYAENDRGKANSTGTLSIKGQLFYVFYLLYLLMT